jgi:uncharacterized membrane protein
MVADTRGDANRGGVSGTGPVPDSLPVMLGGPIAANYGAQTSGPHPSPPADLARNFLAACRAPPRARADSAAPPPRDAAAVATSPCLVQGSEKLRNPPLRAIGTEPFWGARIEGRCVTYSHPEDQAGTRIWTRYGKGPDGETWSGALAGRPFTLRIRPAPGCSDGMSDRRYPFAAALEVQGEKRTGCATPL